MLCLQIIKETARFVRHHGPQVEIVLRVKQGDHPNFRFLLSHDPLHAYFRWVLDNRTGPGALAEPGSAAAGSAGATEAAPVAEVAGAQLVASQAAALAGEEPASAEMHSEVDLVAASTPQCPSEAVPLAEGHMQHAGFIKQSAAGAGLVSAATTVASRDPGTSTAGRLEPSANVPPAALADGTRSLSPAVPAAAQGVASDAAASASTAVASTSSPSLPPADIHSIIQKFVAFVKRNGVKFEATVRQREAKNPKFGFMLPWNPHHAYYESQLEEVIGTELTRQVLEPLSQVDSSGDVADASTAIALKSEVSAAASSTEEVTGVVFGPAPRPITLKGNPKFCSIAPASPQDADTPDTGGDAAQERPGAVQPEASATDVDVTPQLAPVSDGSVGPAAAPCETAEDASAAATAAQKQLERRLRAKALLAKKQEEKRQQEEAKRAEEDAEKARVAKERALLAEWQAEKVKAEDSSKARAILHHKHFLLREDEPADMEYTAAASSFSMDPLANVKRPAKRLCVGEKLAVPGNGTSRQDVQVVQQDAELHGIQAAPHHDSALLGRPWPRKRMAPAASAGQRTIKDVEPGEIC